MSNNISFTLWLFYSLYTALFFHWMCKEFSEFSSTAEEEYWEYPRLLQEKAAKKECREP